MKKYLLLTLIALIAVSLFAVDPTVFDELLVRENLRVSGNVTVTGIKLNSPVELVLDSNITGSITVTQVYHKVDTLSDAAIGTMNVIAGGSIGDLLTLTSTLPSQDIVLASFDPTTGNLKMASNTFSLTTTSDVITFMYDGSNWLETGNSNND